jgi:cytidyltransferase-like protein
MKTYLNRYALYIGRFQPFHEGHIWCIKKIIHEGNNVCIAVMDIHALEPENNPYKYQEVYDRIKNLMSKEYESGQIIITKIPPINSVNYGRDVGYKIVEHKPPKDIKKISATKIRNSK